MEAVLNVCFERRIFFFNMNKYLGNILLTFLFLCNPCFSQAQQKTNSVYLQYIAIYRDLAIEQMKKYHIPASITLAQGLFESAAGKSTLATMGNNHFGIKCGGSWTGATMRKDDDAPNECFRVYSNPRESYEDHSQFLLRDRYKTLFSLRSTDYRGWANGLKNCGYATNPQYAQRLINLIETYKLYQYDTQRTYDSFKLNHSVTSARITLKGQEPHEVFYYNKNYYMIARRGDTFKMLSRETGISAGKLARYNERDKVEVLNDGDVIYLEKKRKHATKQYKHIPHVVRAGESMYTIAQHYGIRLESLYKMNHLGAAYTPQVGDRLRVY